MPTYGQILRDIEAALTKQAFIPPPSPQGQGGQPGQAGPPQGQPGMDATGAPQGQPGAGGPPDPSQGMTQDPSQGQPPQDPSQGQGDPNMPPQDAGAAPENDLAPKPQTPGLKQTMLTLSVADLLDLHSGGKATQSHLKTEQRRAIQGGDRAMRRLVPRRAHRRYPRRGISAVMRPVPSGRRAQDRRQNEYRVILRDGDCG